MFGKFALFLGILRNKSFMMEFQVMYYILCNNIGGQGEKRKQSPHSPGVHTELKESLCGECSGGTVD